MVEEKIRSVYELIAKQYGADVSIEDLSLNLSIGTTDLIIAANDPKVVAMVVINLSANVLYLRPVGVASATAGIRLAAAGGSLSMGFQTDSHLPSLEWHALASGAASAIYGFRVRLR